MKCQNCGENDANVKYTQIINGIKKQMSLCDKCSEELGINNIDFNIPISFSNFLGDIFDEYNENGFMKNTLNNSLICKKCGINYQEFLESGKFGCDKCYETFNEKIDTILKNIQGTNRHVGRIGDIENKITEDKLKRIDTNNKEEQIFENTKEKQLEILKEKLREEIREERYEDAAKTRDEIKKINNE